MEADSFDPVTDDDPDCEPALPSLPDCFLSEGRYDTGGSSTTDLFIATPTGALSVKIVTSSNGRKTSVYSGFDPVLIESAIVNGTMRPDHKYLRAQTKAVEKWRGTQQSQDVDASHILQTYPEIADALGHDKDLRVRIVDAFGFLPEEPSIADLEHRKTILKAQAELRAEAHRQAEKIRLEEVHDRYIKQLNLDPEWGMF